MPCPSAAYEGQVASPNHAAAAPHGLPPAALLPPRDASPRQPLA